MGVIISVRVMDVTETVIRLQTTQIFKKLKLWPKKKKKPQTIEITVQVSLHKGNPGPGDRQTSRKKMKMPLEKKKVEDEICRCDG